jgi:hypothetical protein
MRVSEPIHEVEYQRTQLALGRPVDTEALLDLAERAMRDCEEAEGRAERLDELLGDVLRAFDRLETAKGKPKQLAEAMGDLLDELRYAAQETGYVSLTVEGEDDG